MIVYLILSFLGGYWFCKKKDQILTFIRSLKYLYTRSKEKQVYNDFFETNFSESDYVNLKERGDVENV